MDEVHVRCRRSRCVNCGYSVQPGLDRPPVVAGPPVLGQLAQVLHRHPALPAATGRAGRPAGGREPASQLVQICLCNVDTEWDYRKRLITTESVTVNHGPFPVGLPFPPLDVPIVTEPRSGLSSVGRYTVAGTLFRCTGRLRWPLTTKLPCGSSSLRSTASSMSGNRSNSAGRPIRAACLANRAPRQ